MAITVQVEVRLRQPLDVVFDALVAVERWPEWLIASGIVRVAVVGGAPVAAGSRLTIEQRVAGRAGTIQATITTFEVPGRFALSGRDADGISLAIRADLVADLVADPVADPVADGFATVLRWDLRLGLPLKYRMFEGMAKPQVKRAVALDLEAFRRRVEGATAD